MSNFADEFRKTYDSYEIIGSIGKNIWHVRLSSYNRIAVLKQVENADIYKKLKALDINGIPHIINIFGKDEKQFVIEDYINGDTLADIIRTHGKLSAKQVRNIVIQLCDILVPIHKANIVHRDIKPSNIILTAAGTVYLIDFGIARATSEYDSDTRKLGTQFYASPEQYGFKQTDSRSDIYSIGKLMIVLLSGKEREEDINKLPFGNIIKKCIQIDADRRYKNILELKAAFYAKNPILFVLTVLFILSAMYFIFAGNTKPNAVSHIPNSISEKTETDTSPEISSAVLPGESTEPVTESVQEHTTLPQTQTTTFSAPAIKKENPPEVSTAAVIHTLPKTQAPKPQTETPAETTVIEQETLQTEDSRKKSGIRWDKDGYALDYGYFGTATRFGTLFTTAPDGYGTYILECKDETVSRQKAEFYVYKDQRRIEALTIDTDESGIKLSLCGKTVFIPKTENAKYIKTQYMPESTFYEIMYCDLDYDGIFDILVVETGVYNIPDTTPLYAVIHPVKVDSDVQMTLCKGDRIALYDTDQSAEVLANRITTYNYQINDNTAIAEYHTFIIDDNKVTQIDDMAQTSNLIW